MHQRVSTVKFVNRQLDQGAAGWEERRALFGLGPWWALKDQSGPGPSPESNLRAGCFLQM